MKVTVELSAAEVADRLEQMARAGAYHKLTPDARALLFAVADMVRQVGGTYRAS
jgi:hypothetical protein